MKMWLKLAVVAMLCAGNMVKAQSLSYPEQVQRYIAQYRDVAISEQKRSGIPASITLAQGIHETQAGNSRLATLANNHFGIKCKKEWTGETFAHTDDAPDECFRKYPSALMSYKDHSDYLVKSPRYAELFKLSVTDYAGWAMGLKKAGYATNPRYAAVLIKLVEDYHLQDFTYAAMGMETGSDIARYGEVIPEHDAPVEVIPATTNTKATITTAAVSSEMPAQEVAVNTQPPASEITRVSASGIKTDQVSGSAPQYGQVTRVHGLKAVYARQGDTPLEYAFKHDIRYERLLEINDIGDRPLPFDMYLYLERKNFTGDVNARILKEGESLLQIAQEEGVQLKFLRAMNLLDPGEEPAPGAQIELQHRARVKPAVIAATKTEVPRPAIVTRPVTEVVATTNITPADANQHPEETERKEIPAPLTATAEDAPVKPLETAAPVPAPVATNKAEESSPKDELDALKAKFDRVIYSNATDAPQPETSQQQNTPPAAKEESKPAPGGAQYYVVKKGDTAFSIAKRNNITMRQLMDWNRLDFEGIKVGQKLRVQ